MRKHNQIHTLGTPHYQVQFRFFEKINTLRAGVQCIRTSISA